MFNRKSKTLELILFFYLSAKYPNNAGCAIVIVYRQPQIYAIPHRRVRGIRRSLHQDSTSLRKSGTAAPRGGGRTHTLSLLRGQTVARSSFDSGLARFRFVAPRDSRVPGPLWHAFGPAFASAGPPAEYAPRNRESRAVTQLHRGNFGSIRQSTGRLGEYDSADRKTRSCYSCGLSPCRA